MGRPKPGNGMPGDATSPASTPTAPPINTPPSSVPQNSPMPQGSPYNQRSPHVQVNVPQGYGSGASYPPTPPVMNQPIGAPWSTGLFDCTNEDNNAIMTAFFPCVTYGQISEILEEGQTTCTIESVLYLLLAPALCSCWILGAGRRLKLRNRYNLVQAPAEDWVLHLFCPCCALCQEFRELKLRGIDPSLGYLGNLALAQRNATATDPPKPQYMSM